MSTAQEQLEQEFIKRTAETVSGHEGKVDPHPQYHNDGRGDARYLGKSLATAASLFLVSSGVGAWLVKTVTEVKELLGLSEKGRISEHGGYMVRLTNRTGAVSVKGTVLTASDTFDNAVELESAEFEAAAIMYDNGVANGELCWVVVSGVAEVLLEDGTASICGDWMRCATTDGRGLAAAPPTGIGALSTSDHFKEIGHCLETKAAGVNVLAKALLHFN